MGRLIDTENFSKAMKDYFTDMITHHKYNVDCVDCNADLQHLLDEQPTAYDVDKVVEELVCENCESCSLLEVCAGSKWCGECHNKIVEIVKQGIVSDDVCEWRLCDEEANVYDTSCRNPHILIDGAPEENNYKYCPYCGKKIKVVDNDE